MSSRDVPGPTGTGSTGIGPLVLEPLDGRGARLEVPGQGLAVVGSSPERAVLVVEGEGVDGAHCAIGRARQGHFAVKDLGSRSGTFVNGARVASAKLAHGDVLGIGARRLRVVDPAVSEPPAPPPRSIPSRTIPSRIGGFRIERLLGRGGMGEVYLAIQESLNRPVALKVLSAELAADRDFVHRLQSEARAAAALSHPNVVVVYDAGEGAGLHYVSMEYMPGGNLEQRIAAEGPLDWREVLDVLRDAAAGLAYAESKGIVHRDIKPANLMLSAAGTVKLADLGLATEVDAAVAERRAFGTPHFVSPEQARGESVDHRSDLYSLGATAYRLLTGRTPFQGATTREILLARFQSDPTPPREFEPAIPPAVEALVLRLMARVKEERPASAETLAREVDRIRLEADHGIAARRPSRKLQTLVLGLLLLVVAGAAAYVFGFLGKPRVEEPADVAADPTPPPPERAPEDAAFFQAPASATSDEADERTLEVLELEAKVAYHEIPPALSSEERIRALRDVAARFAATATGRTAAAEATRLETERNQGLLETERLERGLSLGVEHLRKELGWPGAPEELPRPFELLRRAATAPPPPDPDAQARFAEARSLVATEIAAVSERLAREALARAEAAAARGEFADLRETLAALAARYGDPEPLPPGVDDVPGLRALAAEAAARLAGLDAEERVHAGERLRQERALLAGAIGPHGAALEELARLDFAALERELADLGSRLTSEECRVRAQELGAELARARGALELLVETYRDGGWRRFSVGVPVNGKVLARDVVGASERGLLLAGAGGAQPDEVLWPALIPGSAAVDPLFRSRLARAYTAEDYEKILALLRVVAATQGARIVEQLLEPGTKEVLAPEDARALAGAFEPFDAWVDEARAQGVTAGSLALEREREAAELLAHALLASQEESWTLAAADAERLLGHYADTWLVQLLSAGPSEARASSEARESGEARSADGAPRDG